MVPSGCLSKGPMDGVAQMTEIYSLQAWRLESQTHVWVGLVLLRPLSRASRRPSPPRVLPGPFLCVCLCPDLLFL